MADPNSVSETAPSDFRVGEHDAGRPVRPSVRQLDALKAHIMAYKLISVNVPLPPDLQHKVAPSHGSVLDVSSGQSAGPDVPDASPGPSAHSCTALPGTHVAMKLLYNMLHGGAQAHATQPASTSSTATSRLAGAPEHVPLLFPAVIPDPLDKALLLQEKERNMQARMAERIRQLEALPLDTLSNTLKLKALIELKGLRLAAQQKKLRHDILSCMQRVAATTSFQALGGHKSGMFKKSSIRAARPIDRHRGAMVTGAHDKHRKERQKHLDFINSIIERHKEFTNYHRGYQSQKLNKLAKGVLHLHSLAEKEEMKRSDKLAKERISALKADDEEAYLKLLDQQKDTRLTHLIRQTDIYLESLMAMVRAQKQEAAHRDLDMNTADEDEEENGDGAAHGGAKADYYLTAHRIHESVTAQPHILIGGKLKDYQLKGLQWMLSLYNNRLNGILADEMGLGKTIQTIGLISYLIERKNQNGPYLIIVPLSTMTNWSLEFEKWAPFITKIEYKGTPSQRKNAQLEAKHGRFNVLLTTYEYVIKDKAFLSKIKWLYMIIDEGHRMKNTQSKLTLTLTSYYSARYRLILTGTPLQNNLPELWALLNFILPKIFNSGKGFDEWFNAPFANTGERLELNEEEALLIIRRLHKVLRPFLLRRLKKDVESELPDKIERIIKIPMSSLQARLYASIKQKNLLRANPNQSGNVGIRRFNNTIMQLRKICNHPFVFEEVERQVNPTKTTNDLLYRVSGKFELLGRILSKFKASGHRVLIFFQMTTVMTVMEDFLSLEGYTYMRLDGSTKSDDRSAMLKQFNAPDSPYFIFLLSTRAGGLGLNLQTADTVIIFDSDWNPHQDLQAQDRAHRIGQTKEVRIFRLVTLDSVEEVILAKAQFKLNIDGKVIQAGKFDHKSTNEERDALLRAIIETESGAKHEESDSGIFDDEELIQLIARSEEEVALFKRMDAEEQRKRGKSRLIEESELPQVYLDELEIADGEEDGSAAITDYGKGQRIRKPVTYGGDDDDDVFLKSMEASSSSSGPSDIDEREKRRMSTPSRAGSMKRRRTMPLEEVESTDDLQSEDAGTLDGGDDDTSDTSSSIAGKRGRPAKPKVDPLSPTARHRLQSRISALITRLTSAVDATGRFYIDMFMDLPPKALYPDYYTLISRPISMSCIQKKLNAKEYASLEEFVMDMKAFCENARLYNMEGSLIYNDAGVLWDILDKALKEQSASEETGMGDESPLVPSIPKLTLKLNLK